MKENTIKAALAAALGALCAYGIQLLVPVLVLLVVMVLDYITGMAKAWHAGELSSRVGLWGILKKVGYLVIVGVACVVDWLLRYGADSLGWNWPVDFLFASIVIIWLVINELLSILENVSAIGAPVPGFINIVIAIINCGIFIILVTGSYRLLEDYVRLLPDKMKAKPTQS